MTDLERLELAARRTSDVPALSQATRQAFLVFANEIAKVIASKKAQT